MPIQRKLKKDGTPDMRGGIRKGQGRPSKSEEHNLIEKLDKIIEADEVITKLKEMASNGDFRAIQLYMAYRFGRPVERQITMTQEVPIIDMNSWK